ncbi:hypothetical protein V6N12_045889 [Hibiscus sabdariffa]|uniref:Uncharacterized protein n=1 Tax=Hibiscus sabdariffa TaxID=183260 RepID=A0ABR2G473_9ROSI
MRRTTRPTVLGSLKIHIPKAIIIEESAQLCLSITERVEIIKMRTGINHRSRSRVWLQSARTTGIAGVADID